jgi:hypothetical protein
VFGGVFGFGDDRAAAAFGGFVAIDLVEERLSAVAFAALYNAERAGLADTCPLDPEWMDASDAALACSGAGRASARADDP